MKQFILPFLLLTSCGTEIDAEKAEKIYLASRKLGIHKVNAEQQKISRDLVPFVREFEKTFKKEVNISVYISNDLEIGVYGICVVYPLIGIKRVKVNHIYWEALEVSQKWTIMFHELLHCVNNVFGHDNTLDEDGLCESIMHENAGDIECSEKLYNNKNKTLQGFL